jgi:predicted tellurium resistance membrane protein TerC
MHPRKLNSDRAASASTGTSLTHLSRRWGCFVMLSLMSQEATALFQVILIDLVLAGDNAIVIGLAAAGLPLEQRAKAVLIGIVAATVLRISFALATTQLLQVVGLVLAGGILLLWVSWKMFRELRTSSKVKESALEVVGDANINADGTISKMTPPKSRSCFGALPEPQCVRNKCCVRAGQRKALLN